MTALRCLAAFLFLFSASTVRAEEELTSDQWSDVVGFVDQTLSTARSGSDNSRSFGRDVAINVVPQKAVSRSTGEICGAGCYDPCRGFELTVTRDDGRAIYEYSGRRCASSADFSTWRSDGSISLDRVRRSGPDPDLIQRAASYLAALAYLPDEFGTPDADRTMAALSEFRRDAQTQQADNGDITPADIGALRTTVERSNRTGTCAAEPRTRFAACGSSSF
ncbi:MULTISPECIES: hypothetical protein [unclassified Aureimonas]|uniref:hypothetical protein n=1 Tax=unclassified Aureimonas TaxID=2615206 RepID=UPI0006FC40AE|nr:MULTISPECIES: hypothetical protein [unclassified Aureimonas]KQT69848.1 hypothetical protein ASG62_01710 [Aureimonas sp. Leaf427]KQT76000.1 hypothetical protein ASG54_14510 [Aureimonas sp. Leaf460]